LQAARIPFPEPGEVASCHHALSVLENRETRADMPAKTVLGHITPARLNYENRSGRFFHAQKRFRSCWIDSRSPRFIARATSCRIILEYLQMSRFSKLLWLFSIARALALATHLRWPQERNQSSHWKSCRPKFQNPGRGTQPECGKNANFQEAYQNT